MRVSKEVRSYEGKRDEGKVASKENGHVERENGK